ncbi:MAG: acetate--CoA ligase family protein [Sporichthyaceae bacterium]|nr:acetate--CoA ligase family protein [Sporichthyaceae bacterium]
MRDLTVLFDPASIAVVGASDDPSKWGNAIARQALRAGERRPVYLVNRRGRRVLGRRSIRSLAELDDPVELAVLAVPATAFEAAVDDALAHGVKAIVGITAGLGETGALGQAKQAAITERVRAAGAVLVGPNCLGLVDNSTQLYLASDTFDPGSVALLSQSGNLALELQLLLARRGLGFSRFVSLGNQADLTVTDLVRACTADPQTRAIAIYAEDFLDGRAFAAATGAAVTAGKPVVVLAAGRGAAAARSAASHTGAMTSQADVVAAACRQVGVHRAKTPRELADLLSVLIQPRRPTGPRVAILTDGGGHGVIAADAVEAAGLRVPELHPQTRDHLRSVLWPPSVLTNPVDLAGMGERDPHCYPAAAQILLAAEQVDAVVLTGFFGGYAVSPAHAELASAEASAAEDLTKLMATVAKPLLVQSMYPDSPACRQLVAEGIPVFASIEDAVFGLVALAGPDGGERGPTGLVPLPKPARPLSGGGYLACRQLLVGAGIAVARSIEVRTEAELKAAAARLRAPYVLKAMGSGLHKSDSGGVALGLIDGDALLTAQRRMQRQLDPPSFTVEEMAEAGDGVELIVGSRWDPRFGPVLMVGLGGVLTEVLHDVSFALAPVDEAGARRMLGRLRAAALLGGVRGRPAVDLGATAAAIARFSVLAASHPEITEMEINPLLATPVGAVALDARAILG